MRDALEPHSRCGPAVETGSAGKTCTLVRRTRLYAELILKSKLRWDSIPHFGRPLTKGCVNDQSQEGVGLLEGVILEKVSRH